MTHKILVTGAGGFVGAHLIKRLGHDPNNEIFAAVYKATSDLSGLLPADHVMAGDLTDFAYAESLVKSVMPDVVYHLAALSVVHNSVAEAGKVLVGNTILQYNLLESLRLHAQSARILAVCSANEYGLVAKENPFALQLPPLLRRYLVDAGPGPALFNVCHYNSP